MSYPTLLEGLNKMSSLFHDIRVEAKALDARCRNAEERANNYLSDLEEERKKNERLRQAGNRVIHYGCSANEWDDEVLEQGRVEL